MLETHDHVPEAIDAYLKALKCDPGSTGDMHNLIACYRCSHQTEKAAEWEQRLRSLLVPKIQQRLATTLPADPVQASNQLIRRANLYAQMGDFSKAKADLSESLRLHASQIARVTLACIELYLGNEQAYSDLRVRFLAANTSSTRYKLLVGEAGLLRPLSAEELSNAAKWVESGSPTTQPASVPSTLPLTRPSDPEVFDYQSDLAGGMLDFRLGEFNSAIHRLTRCCDEVEQIYRTNPFGFYRQPDPLLYRITAEFYLAMCEQKFSQHTQARQTLAEAREDLVSEFGALGGEIGYGSTEWLILHIAAREAEAIVNPQSPATVPASQP